MDRVSKEQLKKLKRKLLWRIASKEYKLYIFYYITYLQKRDFYVWPIKNYSHCGNRRDRCRLLKGHEQHGDYSLVTTLYLSNWNCWELPVYIALQILCSDWTRFNSENGELYPGDGKRSALPDDKSAAWRRLPTVPDGR
jgi:hypothetical protein